MTGQLYIQLQCRPAVLNGGCCICVLLLQQRPGPVHVVPIQPVVVDAQRVLQIVHRVVPPARHKYGFTWLLHYPFSQPSTVCSYQYMLHSAGPGSSQGGLGQGRAGQGRAGPDMKAGEERGGGGGGVNGQGMMQ